MKDKGYGEGDTHARWIWRKDTISYLKTPTNTRNIEMKYGQQWEIWRREGDDGKMSLVQVDFSLEIGTISHPKTLENSQKQMKTVETNRKLVKTLQYTLIYLKIAENTTLKDQRKHPKTTRSNIKKRRGLKTKRGGQRTIGSQFAGRGFFFYHLPFERFRLNLFHPRSKIERRHDISNDTVEFSLFLSYLANQTQHQSIKFSYISSF